MQKSDDNNNIEHIAIIMDGNGRWAKLKNKSRSEGHRAGSKNVIEIVEAAIECGVEFLTLYAFSTENWKRPEEEKKSLFKLLNEFYKKEIKRLIKNNILIQHIGDISLFPKETIKTIEDTEKKTKEKCVSPTLTVVLALNYGSYDEIKRAVKKIVGDVENKKIEIKDIDENTIASHLDTSFTPNPDLIIRTSGEYRLSNFLLYQAAYSELYFTDTLWPDFSKEEFKKIIEDYKKRERRYGGL